MNGSGKTFKRHPDPHDAHCRIPGCVCTHDGDCYRGWLDITSDGREYAIPCRTCRPAQRRVTQLAPDRAAMRERLQARAKTQQWTGG
jgi:hypothetical protein